MKFTFSENLGLQLTSVEEVQIAEFVQSGSELPDELNQKLFDFFCDTDQMPYGTAKARDGDPYEWIQERLERSAREIGVLTK